MPRQIDVFQATIDPEDAKRILEIRERAIVAFQDKNPELKRASLIKIDEETWLDILEWECPVDLSHPDRAVVDEAVEEMHRLAGTPTDHYHGELVHTVGFGEENDLS